jgi:hypothetical protein
MCWSLRKVKVKSRRGSRKESENTLKNRLALTSSECRLTCNTKCFEGISLHWVCTYRNRTRRLAEFSIRELVGGCMTSSGKETIWSQPLFWSTLLLGPHVDPGCRISYKHAPWSIPTTSWPLKALRGTILLSQCAAKWLVPCSPTRVQFRLDISILGEAGKERVSLSFSTRVRFGGS